MRPGQFCASGEREVTRFLSASSEEKNEAEAVFLRSQHHPPLPRGALSTCRDPRLEILITCPPLVS